MTFEAIPNGSMPTQEQPRFYPERMSDEVDQSIQEIAALMSGETERIELSAAERAKIIEFENPLGEKLDAINKITLPTATLYLDFLATQEGCDSLYQNSGLVLDTENIEEI